MTNEEFFRNNHLDTIDKAKIAYIMCGCNKYHLWHDYTDKLKEYEALGITREQELEWTKEQFLIEIKTVYANYGNDKEWWYMYRNLIEKLGSLKEKALFEMAINLTYDLISKNIDINHYHILNSIVGNNSSQTHGGFIEYAMKNEYLDIGQRVFYLAIDLINKVRPIITEEQTEHLNWLCDNMKDETLVWPELNIDYRQNVLDKMIKKFKKYIHS